MANGLTTTHEGPFSRSWGNNPPLGIVAGLRNLLIEVLRLHEGEGP